MAPPCELCSSTLVSVICSKVCSVFVKESKPRKPKSSIADSKQPYRGCPITLWEGGNRTRGGRSGKGALKSGPLVLVVFRRCLNCTMPKSYGSNFPAWDNAKKYCLASGVAPQTPVTLYPIGLKRFFWIPRVVVFQMDDAKI